MMPDIYPAIAAIGVLAVGIAFALLNGVVSEHDDRTQKLQEGNPNP